MAPFSVTPIVSELEWSAHLKKWSPEALFQTWEWGQVQEGLGNTVWRVGVYDGKTLLGLAQVVKVVARRGTFLHIRHGPVLADYTMSAWEAIISWAKDLAHRERAWFVRVNPILEESSKITHLLDSIGAVPAPIHAMDAELCWVLDLAPSLDEMLAAMRKTTRYEIRRAQKLGVTIERSNASKDLSSFFALYKQTAARHDFVPHRGILEEFEVFARSDRALLYLAFHEGTLLAGAVILFVNGQAIYHHGASLLTKIPASYLIQWEAISDAKKRSMNVYNFWGIAPDDRPNHPWRGLTLFKTGFGGRLVKNIHAHDIPVSSLYHATRAVETARRIWRGY